jgi:pyrimidine deaminase RibD-like protein/uncharacterized protein YuzE
MAQREPRTIVIPSEEELLSAARERVNLPPGKLWLDYQDDVDTLYIALKEKTNPTHSKSDVDDMVVFDYEGEELVGIEIMDITGQLKYADPENAVRTIDERYMELAISEAQKSVSEDERTHPKVGVVVVRNGQIIAVAHRGETGMGDHAEFGALEVKLAHAVVAGATVYTTLEPCTTRQHPKMACAHRLIERKVGRVVIGMLDPNPDICGRGQQLLRTANTVTELFPNQLMAMVEDINREFTRTFTTMVRSVSGAKPNPYLEASPQMPDDDIIIVVKEHLRLNSKNGEIVVAPAELEEQLKLPAGSVERLLPEILKAAGMKKVEGTTRIRLRKLRTPWISV